MFAALGKLFNSKSLTNFLIPIILSVLIGNVIISFAPNYYLICLVVLAPFVIIPLLNKPFLLLQILILVIPFSNTELLTMQIMEIPGLKVINTLFVLTFVSFILKNVRANTTLYEKVFIVGALSFFFIAVLRSMPQIPFLNIRYNENFNEIRYFQSFFLRPMIYFTPFIFISLYLSDFKKVELFLKTQIFSITVFSIFLLGIYLFFTPDKTDFENIRTSFSSVMHLHGNNIATIFATSFPLLISYYFIKKNVFSIFSIILAVITIGILYSRTAYLLTLLSVFIYLFISKRFKWVPIICGVLLLASIFLPSSISQRAMTGLESKDVFAISAGRVEGIWFPLIEEVLRNPQQLVFGNGLKAILFMEVYKKGHIYRTGHAHNLYLNTILDMGLIGLTFYMLFFILLISKFFNAIKRNSINDNQKEILIGVIVAIISFLVSGFTGRLFYPTISNYPIWLILAIGSAILKIQGKKEKIGIQ